MIMGVRHREFLVEGVQFHPESILTAEGRTMIKNFLKMQGGTWSENERLQQAAASSEKQPPVSVEAVNGSNETTDKSTSILERIYAQRKVAVAAQKQIPSQRPEDLQQAYDLDLAPPSISFPERLRQSPYPLSLCAEIKRASPSKGVIAISACAPAQARTYALAGASVISVLTEPDWFKGSIEDLRSVRQALNAMPNRPAVLRKEFVFDEYQILEARLAGADTVLLIVKMLDVATLTRLYKYSQSLGMEPLVEVNNVEEMEVAVKLGSQVIGVNNRNLTNFEVDLETTSRLTGMVPKETILCALSGISGPADVEAYKTNGVRAVLVGEALMRAKDTAEFVAQLLGGDAALVKAQGRKRRFVKICGTRSAEAALVAMEAGADLIGIILVKGRKRCVSDNTALEISRAVHHFNGTGPPRSEVSPSQASSISGFFEHAVEHKMNVCHRPLLVGVFQNQPLEYILEQQIRLELDIVQLHGKEPIEWATLIPVPVIHAFHPGDPGLATRGYHVLPLLDAGVGGTGEKLDLGHVRDILQKDEDLRIMLAGGLNAENIQTVMSRLERQHRQIAIIDVSSGVEHEGEQSLQKIQEFVAAANRLVFDA